MLSYHDDLFVLDTKEKQYDSLQLEGVQLEDYEIRILLHNELLTMK